MPDYTTGGSPLARAEIASGRRTLLASPLSALLRSKHMTCEFDYLLAAVRQYFQPESPLPPAEGLDWGELLDLADRHAVTQFLYRASKNPELRDRVQQGARFGLTLSAELVKIVNLFESQAIDVIPLKGPVLGAALYGGEALKISSDLDLFVRPADAIRAKHSLEGAGYRLESVPHWPGDGACLRNPIGELSFSNPAGSVSVDLHWRLLPGFFSASFDQAAVWKRPGSVSWGRAQVRTLAPEHLLLFLSAHGSKHLWERLGWLCDAARLIQVAPGLDWSEVIAEARRADTLRTVSLTLTLARDLLGVELPAAAAGLAGGDARTRDLARSVLERLRADRPVTAVDTAVFGLRAFERSIHRARLVYGIFLQPTEAEYRVLQLPPRLFWLYYLFRPARLAVKYARRMAGL